MTARTNKQTAGRTAAPVDLEATIEPLVFVLLTILVCVRSLVGETFIHIDLSYLGGMAAESGPTPATTGWLDTTTLLLAVLGLGLHPGRGAGWRAYRIGVGLLTAGVIVSTLYAGNQRVALDAGANLLIAVLAGGALVQLARTRWMRHVLIAGLLASGAATASKALADYYVFQPDAAAQFAHFTEGMPEGAAGANPLVENFRRRVLSAEAQGFLNHPNVTAAVLTMWGLVAAGLLMALVVDYRRRRDETPLTAAVGAAALLVALGFALQVTGSFGGWVAGAAGLVFLAVLGWRAATAGRSPTRTTALLAGLYAAVMLAAIGYGLFRGTLPHPSLAFRWNYWSAAGAAYADAPLTGVGRENFVDAYMLHRPPQSSEDVRNPHNLWVTALTELGPLGLAGIAVLVLLAIRGAMGRLAAPPQAGAPESVPRYVMVAVPAGVLLVQLMLSEVMDSAATPEEQSALLLLWLVGVAGVWAAVFFVAWAMLRQVTTLAAERWLLAGLVAALGANLVHNIVGFSLLTPGGLCTFVAIVAAALAIGGRPAPTMTRRVMAPLAALVLAVAHFGLVSWPLMRAEQLVRQYEIASASAGSPSEILATTRLAQEAFDADPLDPAVPLRVARWQQRLAGPAFIGYGENPAQRALVQMREMFRINMLERAYDSALVAAERWAGSGTPHIMAGRIAVDLEQAYLTRGQLERADDALARAAEHWQLAAARQPTAPRVLMWAGITTYYLARETETDDLLPLAAAYLEAALEIDAARDPRDAHRFDRHERQMVARYLAPVRAKMGLTPAAGMSTAAD